MPTSRVELIPSVINAIRECNLRYGVKTILDVGCGAGLYGALIRQYMDFNENKFDIDRDVELVGVEGYKGYTNPNYSHYDKLHIKTIQEFLKESDRKFDVILACDVIEHMDITEAQDVMRKLYDRTEKYLIITTPTTFRNQWEPKKAWESDLQEHKSRITPDLLEALFPRTRVIDIQGGLVWTGVVIQEHLPV